MVEDGQLIISNHAKITKTELVGAITYILDARCSSVVLYLINCFILLLPAYYAYSLPCVYTTIILNGKNDCFN